VNTNELGNTTSNTFTEEGDWGLGEREVQALRGEFDVFSEFHDETVGGRFRKAFIADEIYRILNPALKGIGKIKNKSVEKQAMDMISDIADLIVSIQSQNVDVSRIPSLHAVVLGDGSFLIEWIFSKYRIGFVLEKKKQESIWYLVSTIEKANVERFGTLEKTDKADREKLLAKLVSFVFNYS